VLREGIHLRNPFRYRFEEWTPPAQADAPAAAAAGVLQLLPTAEYAPAAEPFAAQRAAAGAPPAPPVEAAGAAASAAAEPAAPGPAAPGGRPKRGRAAAAEAPEADAPPAQRRRALRGAALSAPARAQPEPEPRARPRSAAARRLEEMAAAEARLEESSQPAAAVADSALPVSQGGAALRTAPDAPVPADAAAAGEAAAAAPKGPPPLPPLPTFEPRAVAPLEGTTLPDVAARLSADCKCGICHELMVAPHALACSHSFCGPCAMVWVRKRAVCPFCRARSGKPIYERILDDIIVAVVEPHLDADEAADRTRRKGEWQAMQVEFAREARETDLQRASAAALAAAAPGGGLASLAGGGRVPYAELQRMLRQSTEQLQSEMRTLHQRFAAVGGDMGPPLRAQAAAAPLPPLDAEARAPGGGVAWSVEYALSGRTVCHTCFTGIPEGTVRVVREAAAPPWADVLAGPAQAPAVRDFHHLACCVPRCPHAALRGMDALREADRQRVNELMATAAEAAAADAAAVQPADALAAAPPAVPLVATGA
jgi:hypothetical protein